MDLGSKNYFDAVATARFGAPASSSLDDSTDVWEVHAGVRFNRYVAAEIGYINLGRGSYVATYPPSFRYSVRFLCSGPTLPVLGIGGSWIINPSYALRVELTRFMNVGKKGQIPEQLDVDALHVSLLFR